MACSLENWTNYGVEIRFSSETKGRGLFTTRAFKSGDKLLEEKPLVSCQFSWNSAYGYSACEFCMRPLESAEENLRRLAAKPEIILPNAECDEINKSNHTICPHCAVTYCTSTCKDQAWNTYHQTLCTRFYGGNPNHPIEKLNEAWKVMHYPPESASVMLLVKILASIIQSSDDHLKDKFLQMCHHTINDEDTIAHKLLGKEFENQLEQLRDLTVKAMANPKVNEFLTPEGFRSLFALMGRNGQGVGTSSFSVWVRNITDADPENDKLNQFIDTAYSDMEKESGDFLNNEGSGLYEIQSSANHSCEPNAQPIFPFSNHVLALEALEDIEANQEVFISYLDECQLARSRHSRRKHLKENYLFLCDCTKCREEIDQPDVTSEEEDESMEED